MLITGKELLPQQSDIVLQLKLDKPEDLSHFEVAGGAWRVEDGALLGQHPGNGGGLIYSRIAVNGDVMMDFYGEMVPPCNNDLNFSFKTEGWVGDNAGRGYIAGVNGWWEKKTGIEKYPPTPDGVGTLAALTPAFRAESGVRYHIQAGCADGLCFLFVDGRLIVELFDPSPGDFDGLGRVGLGTYASKIRFSDLTVYNIRWRAREMAYPQPVF